MHIGSLTTVFHTQSFREAAQQIHRIGLQSVEIGTGGYFPKNHCDPKHLLSDKNALAKFHDILAEFELDISALAIHGEPLHPDPDIADVYDQDFRDTCKLAAKIGVTRMTLLAGLPEAAPGDRVPNWILYPYPSQYIDMFEWQWEARLIPYWKEHGKIAEDHGVRVCFEMHPGDMVFKPEGLIRLRDAVGTVVGCNLDPSHLFWQSMDVLEVIQILGDIIYHVHAKDSRLEDRNVRANGVLDAKTFQDHMNRSWMFRTVGYGHGEKFWRDFVSTLRMVGYDDVISIEHEDPLIDSEEGFELAVRTLQNVIIRQPATTLWYE